MKKIFAILTFWALAGMVSCSNEPEVIDPADGTKTYELSIETDETRVEYNHGGEDGATHKYRWEKGDELAVWYSVANAESYSAIEKPFVASLVETGKPVVFYTSATSPDHMTKGQTYDYIAMYPYPTTISGTDVTYTLGTATAEGAYVQKKEYEGAYQILRAAGEDKIAMTDGRPTLSEYKQLMTTLQFYVNSENSAGAYTDIKITELQIYFPENVTGVLTIDAKTGEIKSATSDRIDVEMSSAPMGAYATRQAAREEVDYVNVVCKPFTMSAYDETTPAENRIVINVIGQGTNVTSGTIETISQSIFKTVSAAKTFAAKDVIAMRLDLTNEWVQVGPIALPNTWLDAFLWNWCEENDDTQTAGYYCNTDGEKVRLSNIYQPQRSSSDFLVSLAHLPNYDSNSTLIIEFDAYAICGDNDEYCPINISSTKDTGVGVFSELFSAGALKVQSVNIANTNSTSNVYVSQANVNGSYSAYPTPSANEWTHYSVTLRNFQNSNYVVFQVDGAIINTQPWRACYIKNLTFSYEKK